MADHFIYLCFHDKSYDDKKCRKSTSPTGQYDEISQTTHDHGETRIASSLRKNELYFTFTYFVFRKRSGIGKS